MENVIIAGAAVLAVLTALYWFRQVRRRFGREWTYTAWICGRE